MDLYKITEQKLYYYNYSKNTINAYLNYVSEFQDKIKKHPSRINAKDIQNYLNTYDFSSTSQQNQVISSLKFAWEKGLGKKYLKINFTRPRKEKKIPQILDQETLIKRITAIRNLKHKAILWLAFSTGMRVSEVINLKVEDIDSKRMIIHIKNAKGRKDRVVRLTEGTLSVLRSYAKEYKPKTTVFQGHCGKECYSASSCNQIVKKYIDKGAHFHLLRHAFACSAVENGTDIHVLQNALGHKRVETSMIYLHITKTAIQRTFAPM